MPRITIAPQWDVNAIEGLDTWTGKLSGDMVYKFKTVDEEGTVHNTICSIADVKPCEDYQVIIPNIIYENNTFRLVDPKNEDDKIFTCDLDSVEEMYIARRQAEHRPRSVSEDPFVFSFLNQHTGRHFSQYVDRDHFVGISKFSASNGRNKIIYGCIDRLSEDGKSIIVNALIGHSGFYTSEERTIRISDIRGIYAYCAVPVTYAEGVKFAEEARAKRAEFQAAKAAKAKVSDTNTKEDTVPEDTADASTDTPQDESETQCHCQPRDEEDESECHCQDSSCPECSSVDSESETVSASSIPPYYISDPNPNT